MNGDDSISDRWRTRDGTALAARVLAAILLGDPLDDLPLDRHDGRIDLRGLIVPEPGFSGAAELAEFGDRSDRVRLQWMTDLIELRGITLADVDLSGAQVAHLRFFDTTLVNCLFEQADCREWRGWNLTVDACSFRGADLRESVLGTWYEQTGNRYLSVDFRGSDLRGVVCEGATFTDCDFGEARLDKIEFAACEVIDTRFAGMLDSVRFLAKPVVTDKEEPGRLVGVDFTAATLRWVDFDGLSLDEVRLPDEGDDHVVVHHYACVVRRAVERLDPDLSPDVRRLRSRMRTALQLLDVGPSVPSVGVWHVDELGKTAEQKHRARSLLHELEAECANE